MAAVTLGYAALVSHKKPTLKTENKVVRGSDKQSTVALTAS